MDCSAIGSHWNGVNGFGTKGLTLRVKVPAWPLSFMHCSVLSARSWIAEMSSSVSSGNPIMIYNLMLGIPARSAMATVPSNTSSVIPLLIMRRSRSLPASGAKVIVRCPLFAKICTNSGVVESARKEATDVPVFSDDNIEHNSSMSGKSETAAPTSPTFLFSRMALTTP